MGGKLKELKRKIFGTEDIFVDLENPEIKNKFYSYFVESMRKIKEDCESGKRYPGDIYLDIEDLSDDFMEFDEETGDDNEVADEFMDLYGELHMYEHEVSEMHRNRVFKYDFASYNLEMPKVFEKFYDYFYGGLKRLDEDYKDGNADCDELLIKIMDLKKDFDKACSIVDKTESFKILEDDFYYLYAELDKAAEKGRDDAHRGHSVRLKLLDIIMHHDKKRLPFVCSAKKDEEYNIDNEKYTHYIVDFEEYDYVIKSDTFEFDDCDVVMHEFNKKDYPGLDIFAGAMAEAMAFEDTFELCSKNPRKPIDDMINEFLKENTGKDYEEFISGVDFRAIEEDDFQHVSGMKKKLFDYRARIYLAALARVDKEPYRLDKVIKAISEMTIYPIKKQEREPVFDYILDNLTDIRKKERIKEKFKDYEFWIKWPDREHLNPCCDSIKVAIKTKDGEAYISNPITTLGYIKRELREQKETGENACGTYCSFPKGELIIKKITLENIKKTLDDLIEKGKIEEHITRYEE